MALVPTYTVCLKKKGTEFNFVDTTGAYNASTNTTGWNSPNEAGSAVTSAYFRITSPSGSVYDYDITSQIPDTITGDIEFTAYLGDWEDGVYQFEYVIVGVSSYNVCTKRFFSPKIDCCIDKVLYKFVDNYLYDDCYDSEEIISLTYFRDMLHVAALNKNETQIKEALEFLEDLCNCLT
ncbi:MAG: hypothetical protein ACI9LF_001175 [Flavobacteriales bacterium]|jgi:hypothetical protein